MAVLKLNCRSKQQKNKIHHESIKSCRTPNQMHVKPKYLHTHDPLRTINTKDTTAPSLEETLQNLISELQKVIKNVNNFLILL